MAKRTIRTVRPQAGRGARAARATAPVPDMVRQFVVYFYRHIREKNGACIFLPMQPREERDRARQRR